MRSVNIWVAVCVFIAALSSAALHAEDFSAEMVSSTGDGIFTSKLYVSGDKSRMEMPEAITISRPDQKVVWMLMPGDKMYMEQPIDQRAAVSAKEKVDGEIERKAEGNEIVDGRDTTKFRVTFESNGKRESVFQWVDESAHIPIKTAAIDGSWSSEIRNIQSGIQDQALFEIPDGYTKMSLGMPDMSGAMGKKYQEEGSSD